jgi:hypothetical protein
MSPLKLKTSKSGQLVLSPESTTHLIGRAIPLQLLHFAKQAAEQGITLEELMDRIALEYQEAKASGKVEVLEKYFSRIDIGQDRG